MRAVADHPPRALERESAADADQRAFEAARDRLVGHLDRVREDCLRLQQSLAEIERAALLNDPIAREVERRAARVAAAGVLHKIALAETAGALRRDLDEHPRVARQWTAGAEAVYDGLNQLLEAIRAGRLAQVAELAGQLVERSAELVVPLKINDRLADYRVGKPFEFDREFDREIPDAAMRRRVLDRLVDQQGRIHGIVDAGSGFIYKQSPSLAYRLLTYLSPVLLTALSVGVLIGLEHVQTPESWGLGDADLVATFALVAAGTAGHLLAESAKQYQLGSIPITPIENGLDWLHLRWVGVAQTFLWMIVVVLGLSIAGVSPETDVALCLAAGYSLDSFAGLFITRFSQVAASGRAPLLRRLGGSSEATAESAPGPAPAGLRRA
jgi:hypothetical protein